MIFEVYGIKLDIPEELIKERKELFFFDTEEETIDDVKREIARYLDITQEAVSYAINTALKNLVKYWVNKGEK